MKKLNQDEVKRHRKKVRHAIGRLWKRRKYDTLEGNANGQGGKSIEEQLVRDVSELNLNDATKSSPPATGEARQRHTRLHYYSDDDSETESSSNYAKSETNVTHSDTKASTAKSKVKQGEYALHYIKGQREAGLPYSPLEDETVERHVRIEAPHNTTNVESVKKKKKKKLKKRVSKRHTMVVKEVISWQFLM